MNKKMQLLANRYGVSVIPYKRIYWSVIVCVCLCEIVCVCLWSSTKIFALATYWLWWYRVWHFIKLCRMISPHWWNYVIIDWRKNLSCIAKLLLWKQLFKDWIRFMSRSLPVPFSALAFYCSCMWVSPMVLVTHFSLLPPSLHQCCSAFPFPLQEDGLGNEGWNKAWGRGTFAFPKPVFVCRTKEWLWMRDTAAQRHMGVSGWHWIPPGINILLWRNTGTCLDLWCIGLNYWAGI